jgi:hypothetical protein
MASKEPMTTATSASGVTTDTQPVDAGSNPKKRKIETESCLFLVEMIDTTEPSEAVSRYLPMKKSDPFAILMYQRVKKLMKIARGGHGETRMDFELHGCDTSGNEGDAGFLLEDELSSKEEKIFRTAPFDEKRKMKKKQVKEDDEDDEDDEDEEDDDADDYEVDLYDEWAKMMDAAENSTLSPYDARTLYGKLLWVRIIKSED